MMTILSASRCTRSAAAGGLAALASVLWLAAGMSPASAHAAYKDSDPADESSVSQPPTEIWAEYTEPLQEGSWMKVFDPCGTQVDAGNVRVEGYRMYVGMSGETQGTYQVEWMAASAVDPHTTKGTFVFTATEGASCPGEETEPKENRAPRASGGRGGGNASSDVDQVASSQGAGKGTSGGGNDRLGVGDNGRRRAEGREGRDRVGTAGDRDDAVAAPNNETQVSEDEPKQPGLLDGIPIGGLVLALAVAAAIGAAGGFIYAGIMGYHRPA